MTLINKNAVLKYHHSTTTARGRLDFQLQFGTSVGSMSLRQTCKVRISGRQMRYRRALQVIQEEEYLSAIDLDDIRLRRVSKRKRLPSHNQVRKRRQTSCKPQFIFDF